MTVLDADMPLTDWRWHFAAALRGEPCVVHGLGPDPVGLPVASWQGRATLSDLSLLAHCVGPTLDVGCGPGRLTEALARTGHPVLGLDVVTAAVLESRRRGVPALLRDVFDPLPGEGRWGTALLADGNIGIGGDPVRLLRRLSRIVAPGGRLVVELAPPGTGLVHAQVRLETLHGRSDPFAWARVGPEYVGALAFRAGLGRPRLHADQNRWFAVIRTAG